MSLRVVYEVVDTDQDRTVVRFSREPSAVDFAESKNEEAGYKKYKIIRVIESENKLEC